MCIWPGTAGFCSATDSFGAFPYAEEYFGERQLGGKDIHSSTDVCGTCAVDWTGCFCLSCSNLDDDINAPPDVMAVLTREPLALQLHGQQRLFVTGLAKDFCVLDTALNAHGLVLEVYVIDEATRAAHTPGVGGFGSGFLSDPAHIVKKIGEKNVKMIKSDQLL